MTQLIALYERSLIEEAANKWMLGFTVVEDNLVMNLFHATLVLLSHELAC